MTPSFKFILLFTAINVTSYQLDAQKIAAGASHSVAICNDKKVQAWGYNLQGQLGEGSGTTRTAPYAVDSVSGIIAVSAYNHTLFLKEDDNKKYRQKI